MAPKATAALLVLVVLVATALPAAALRSTADADADSTLQVSVEQSHVTGDATVTVTSNGSAVENATVEVSGDAYAGNGTYETGPNGTVTLPNPNESVDVTVLANASAGEATTNVTLVPLADSLAVDVTQGEDGNATVTVTQYDAPVANATVNVTGDAYAGNGTYTTGENGTVALPSPAAAVNVTVTATADNLTAETTTTLYSNDLALAVSQSDDGNVTVTVTRNGDPVENATVEVAGDAYVGNGTYETDANGTVTLPAPDGDVTVTVTATHDGDTASATVTLAGATETGDLAIGVSQGADRVVLAVTDDGELVEDATVTVSSGPLAGTYSTGDDGFVVLDAPAADASTTVVAESDEATGERTVAIDGHRGRGPGHTPFGKYVSAYADSLRQDADVTGGYGHWISDFVHDAKDDHRDEKPGNGDDERERGENEERDESDDERGNGNGHGDDHPGKGHGEKRGHDE